MSLNEQKLYPSVFWANFNVFLIGIKKNICNIIKMNYFKKLYVLKN